MLQKFTNHCSALQQSLQTIQSQLSSISDTYGDRETLEQKLTKLMVSCSHCYSIFNNGNFFLFSLKER
jgi:hypothetical protein